MLRFDGLTKAFGGRPILDGATARLAPGAYALQGENGCGKSTLLAMLAGAIAPDAGDVWIDGHSLSADPVVARMRLAYAPDESPVYPFITGSDFLDFVASARQCANVDADLVTELGLAPHLPKRFSAMSLGTQKKVLLCAAWIGAAPVKLLDEPSNGLDLGARDVIARRIARHAVDAVILFASHDAAFVAASGAKVLPFDELVSSSTES